MRAAVVYGELLSNSESSAPKTTALGRSVLASRARVAARETGDALIGHCPERRFGAGDLQGAPPLVDAVGVQGRTGIAAGRAVDVADEGVGPQQEAEDRGAVMVDE